MSKRTEAKARELHALEDEEKSEGLRATYRLPKKLVEELRAASLDVPTRALGGSMSALVARAIERELAALRDEYNDGQPFEDTRGRSPRTGRPPKI